MYISGIDCHIKNISFLVASGLCCICKAFFVFTLVEYSAFGVSGRFINDSFFRRFGVIKRFLAVFFTVFIDFFHQLFFVYFSRLRNSFLNRFFHIGICLDMRSVNEYCFGCKIACLLDFVQYPIEYLFYCFSCKSVLEIVTDC